MSHHGHGTLPTFLFSLHTTYSLPRRLTILQASQRRLMLAFTFIVVVLLALLL